MAVAYFLLASTLILVSLSTLDASYGSVPVPIPHETELYQETFGVQGIVYCRSSSKLSPLKGAVVRVTCLGTDDEGYETAPFSYLSDPTDDKGYFFTAYELAELKSMGKMFECKAFLDPSPSETCAVPTDANNGITGAPLSGHRILTNKKMKLFSVGPFIYTSQMDSSHNGY